MKFSLLLILILLLILKHTFQFDDLVVPKSTQETYKLYNFLKSAYGKYVLSGQTTFSYDDLVHKINKQPLIRGFDMQNYSPHNPWFHWQPIDDGTVDKAIYWYNNQTQKKGIVTFFWHWFSPSGGQQRTSTFYTNNTDFDMKKAVVQGTQQYKDILRDIDAIAQQLIKIKNANIPIIWRPLHQAGGKWFWWGSKTNVQTLKLFNIMFDRFVNYHQINNMIWAWSTPQKDWYPGNNFIDLIGFDSYPGVNNYQCNQVRYYQLKNIVKNNKMIAMTENGPIPQFDKCVKSGILWGFFMGWSDLVFSQNSAQHLIEIYNKNPIIITVQNKNIVGNKLTRQ